MFNALYWKDTKMRVLLTKVVGWKHIVLWSFGVSLIFSAMLLSTSTYRQFIPREQVGVLFDAFAATVACMIVIWFEAFLYIGLRLSLTSKRIRLYELITTLPLFIGLLSFVDYHLWIADMMSRWDVSIAATPAVVGMSYIVVLVFGDATASALFYAPIFIAAVLVARFAPRLLLHRFS